MLKVADVDPGATVTDGGTVNTLVLLDERFTTLPPPGAAGETVTVPVRGLPPLILETERVRDCRIEAFGVAETCAELALSPNVFTPDTT